MDKAEIEKLKKQVRACLTEDCWNCPETATPDDVDDCSEALVEKLCGMIDASAAYDERESTIATLADRYKKDCKELKAKNECMSGALTDARRTIDEKNSEIVELKRKLAGIRAQTENTSKKREGKI